jgi:hypothetical protein
LAGSLPEKSSEKRSSFLAAMGLEGTLGRSAAARVEVRSARMAIGRVIMVWIERGLFRRRSSWVQWWADFGREWVCLILGIGSVTGTLTVDSLLNLL